MHELGFDPFYCSFFLVNGTCSRGGFLTTPHPRRHSVSLRLTFSTSRTCIIPTYPLLALARTVRLADASMLVEILPAQGVHPINANAGKLLQLLANPGRSTAAPLEDSGIT